MIKPEFSTIEELTKSSQNYKVIPLSKEIFSDFITPIEALKKFQSVSDHCYMLESAEDSKQWGRYTFLGFNPTLELTCTNNNLTISNGTNINFTTDQPNQYIKDIITQHKSPKFDYLPSFTGGLVGYFAYDYIKYSEPTLRLDANDEEQFNDVDLMLFDKVVAFDNYKQKIVIIVNIKTDNIEIQYNKGIMEIEQIESILKNGVAKQHKKAELKSELRTLFNKEEYCEMVKKAKQHIFEGDIFQVVLSNRIDADFSGSLLDTYRVLRTINPSPYMFYFSSDKIEIAGASPETLVKCKDGVLHTFPLAGTRPRGKTYDEDIALEKELLSDEKECSEHNMLVDLGRNDIGKVSEFGSVEVEKYMQIERFSHVMHIGSTVKGQLKENKNPLDALDAVLPAGTLSGAPKLKACQIINDLENNKRGIYGGAVGYIDFTGNLDTCIAIRLAFKKNNKVFIRSGAGIVADSVPENEYQECINKAMAVVTALKTSQEEM